MKKNVLSLSLILSLYSCKNEYTDALKSDIRSIDWQIEMNEKSLKYWNHVHDSVMMTDEPNLSILYLCRDERNKIYDENKELREKRHEKELEIKKNSHFWDRK